MRKMNINKQTTKLKKNMLYTLIYGRVFFLFVSFFFFNFSNKTKKNLSLYRFLNKNILNKEKKKIDIFLVVLSFLIISIVVIKSPSSLII